MKLDKVLLWCISVFCSCYGVVSFNILAVLPYQGKSHFFVFEPYLKELARKGHNLTVISYFPQENPILNYNDISLAGKVKILEGVFPVHRSYWSIVQLFLFLYNMGRNNCEVMLSNTRVQNLWKSETKFDLVVTEQFNSDCSLGLAYKLGAPVVGMTSHTLMPWHYERLGIEYNPSYISFPFLEGGTTPTLYQRLERLVFHHFSNTIYKYTCQRVNQNQLQQYFGIPPLEELARDIKLMLLYTHFTLNGPTLTSTNVVEVGGYHVAKPKELPQDLMKFIEESHHGVIYISFGSMLRATSLPRSKLEAIVKVISELPQRVIWKWDEKVLPGNPKNVYLSKWLPQNDILAHPNILAFYSHCGMLSTSEAIYHGVPMIAMPVFGDQPGNAAAVEESGLGVQIQIQDLAEDTLAQKMETVLKPEFRRKVKELSKIWHDRPLSAMDSAIYWTEFAARSKNFTFKNPASTVPLYQYIYLDIITVVVVTFLAATFVLKFVLTLSKKPHSKLIKPKTK